MSGRIGTVLALAATSLAVLSWASSSRAAAPARAESKSGGSCSALSKQLPELESSGRLLEAQSVASACSKPTCGVAISRQCLARAQALEASTPSVVAIAIDESGAPVEAVEVRVDGAVRSTVIDGRPIPLDPGMHEFTFSAKDRFPYVEKLLVVQGERNRRLSAVLRPVPSAPADAPSEAPVPAPTAAPGVPSAAAPGVAAPLAAPAPTARVAREAPPARERGSASSPGRHLSVWPYVAGGTAIAAFGASITFVTWGHNDFTLLDRCTPNCSRGSVDHVRHMYIAADVALGVGVVALGAATWLYLSSPRSEDARADHAEQHFDLRPTTGGAFASWEQEF